MREVHLKMKLSESDFSSFVEIFYGAFETLGIP
jgi:hypothetical protein